MSFVWPRNLYLQDHTLEDSSQQLHHLTSLVKNEERQKHNKTRYLKIIHSVVLLHASRSA